MLFQIHHYHHDEPSDRVLGLLAQILAHVTTIHAQGVHLMADVASIKQLVSDLNDETNAVAAKLDAETAEIARLSAIIAAGGTVTAQDLQDIQDGLQPISDRLKSLGANVAQPIPPPVL
jgi:UDP-N-acetylglucosamine enolpyruvyl transferase